MLLYTKIESHDLLMLPGFIQLVFGSTGYDENQEKHLKNYKK